VNLIHNYILCVMYGYLRAYVSAKLLNSFEFLEFSRNWLTTLNARQATYEKITQFLGFC